MISLQFPDGSRREFKPGVTGREVAESISKSLAKKAVAMSLDGQVEDLAEPIKADAKIRILTRDDPEALDADPPRRGACDGGGRAGAFPRHAGDHRPGDRERLLSTTSPATSPSRRTICRASRPRCARSSRAIRPSSCEVWIARRGEAALRRQGRDLQGRADRRHPRRRRDQDLLAGRMARPLPRPAPDLDRQGRQGVQAAEASPAPIGAAIRSKPMLQRIYGTAWASEERARSLSPSAGRGREARPSPLGPRDGPVPLPGRGAGRRVLASEGLGAVPGADRLHAPPPAGHGAIVEVNSPDMLERTLWEQSGHWEKFGENMFITETPDERVFCCKPMNCPGHVQIFKHGLKSYRDLPLTHCRIRQGASLRAVGRAARPHARAPLHPGRRAYLLHRGSDHRGMREAQRADAVDLSRLRLRGRAHQVLRPARRSASARTRCGTRPRPR